MPKIDEMLIAVDMDHTLMTADDGIPRKNIEAIKEFTARGGKFTVATGRTVISVAHYINELPLNAPAIVFNGGVIYDYSSNEIIYEAVLPSSTKSLGAQLLEKFPNIGLEFASLDMLYIIRQSATSHYHCSCEQLPYTVTDISILPEKWYKIVVAATPKEINKVVKFTQKMNIEGAYFIQSTDIYYELISIVATKAAALMRLAAYTGTKPENTVFVGDYYNDVGAMKAAGYSFAMGNAPDDVKSAAHETVAECLDGGVAQAIYRVMEMCD